MKLGLIGRPLSGKTTVFEALTRNPADPAKNMENRIGTIRVPDVRIDALSRMYQPKKTIYAQIEYFLPGAHGEGKSEGSLNAVRDCDAFIHVLRNFPLAGTAPEPAADFIKLEQELVFNDLLVADKRLERLEADRKRNRPIHPEEYALIQRCKTLLESEQPLRRMPEADSPLLKGYAFLSAKPLLVLFNNADDDDRLPGLPESLSTEECTLVRGQLELEISRMNPEDVPAFLTEFGITESATDRIIKRSYSLLGLISFFTVGEDEVRAWTIPKGTSAVDAAEAIHTDIKKGFIRAEVVSYDDLTSAGSHAAARKVGTVRLEGKTYVVQDGDIIEFRFNV